jgi:hypothetical protein
VPHIVGKGRAEAHPKSLERVTVCRPRATLRLTREATQAHVTCRGRTAPQCSHQRSVGDAAPHSVEESGRSLLHIPDRGRRVKPSSYRVVQELATDVDHMFYTASTARVSDPRYRTLSEAMLCASTSGIVSAATAATATQRGPFANLSQLGRRAPPAARARRHRGGDPHLARPAP